ncbi:MAG TPA: cytochrome-c oxidase, cbb3-type subunit III [Immundisolibacter sp.]|nr:cytochrome-c oxidase, cbb3-type subunit III [Immundisolibacter sp.]
MSSAWSWYVTVLSLANILACVWLIRWTAKKRPGEGSAADTTGHEWDGLKEYNNPMPRWWLGLFYITIVFALGYLLLYPGLGNFKGLLGWTQIGAYEAEVEAVERDVAPLFAKYAALPIPELAKDPAAMATGRRLFVTNCAVCHGADGHGSRGFPNLADNIWHWGGAPEQIEQTITQGRTGMMMAWGAALGEDGVKAVATYVRSLGGHAGDPAQVAAGREKYQTFCIACHGPEGKGNPMLGAPDLTDDYWLYGGSEQIIQTSIRDGRQGVMPAQKDLLSAERIHVLAAYVYGLSHEQP